jgi:NAD(P)-dependent dehydrogenase (short-subunit alcohol dehydrogenase family)
MARGDRRQPQGLVLVLPRLWPPHDNSAEGRIVNLGSMSGLIVNRPQTPASYMASKGAVRMLTKVFATEWAKSGV